VESCPEKTTSLYACLKASEVAGIPPTTICLGNFRLELLGGGSFILMALPDLQRYQIKYVLDIDKENRIYIRVEFRQFLGMNFVSLFLPEREFKVYNSCKCSQNICSRVH